MRTHVRLSILSTAVVVLTCDLLHVNLSFFENIGDPGQLASAEAIQDPQSSLLKMHAYSWNAAELMDKYWGGV